ncbi:SPFH domain-containing protein [Aureibacillus halotolerans]|uniref:Membrane protease subunit (Stomatin/prohibitin family) n=1 Tax=Aureibacillus halotolerans TaxID=1508390 RepID=A0A4R6TUG3_9BACI|nr:SPFH domain-containing protein [Aureibacillus halotolerans]TDQ36232.1 membrane protease subunit (stomatin/prohibitin family) [Aureibacillus halotolerans]
MSFFRSQLANVVEWEEFRDDMIFWKWSNNEIKKGSRLIIRPGQDAIFLNNGKIEGVFEDDGEYDIESQIVPFLSTLKGFRFGFNSGMRVEVLFVNTKEFTVRWGTRSAINIPTPQLPGGMPIRANGTFNFKVTDYVALIDKIAGVKERYLVEDVKIRITAVLDQLLMKWITREGKDMFNLQANAFDISKGIQEDLDMKILDNGLKITGFNIGSFNYPKEIQDMVTKTASHGMISDVGKYQQVEMTDGIAKGKIQSGGVMSDMTGMMMGMNVANKMMENMNQSEVKQQNQSQAQNQNQGQAQNQSPPPAQNANGNSAIPNFCPNCGNKTTGTNFCPNCGNKLV